MRRLPIIWRICFFFATSILSTITADRIDKAIANAILPPSSPLCQDGHNSTIFNSIFYSTNNISMWHEQNAKYEKDVFEIDMAHRDSNVNRSWSLRIGKGGQIVSFIGPYGEAISNQAREKSAWNDLVTQTVSVNTRRNRRPPYNGSLYFIHGSGPYMLDDGMPPPWYNPKLAMDCIDNQCTILNWGQQAHVPTPHRSDVLYYARYRDCGNGVIEYDQAIHHFGNDTEDVLTYFNTPWAGMRTSTFRDILVSNTTGSLEHMFPITGWGTNTPIDLMNTGGFTTFAQSVKFENDTYDPGFCINLTANVTIDETVSAKVDCSANKSIPFQLSVQKNKTANLLTAFLDRFENPISANFCNYAAPVKTGCSVCRLNFVNSRTNFAVPIDGVVHWCWKGTWTIFNSPTINASMWNYEFIAGDKILLKYRNDEKMNVDDNLAFTFVHGTNLEYGMPGNTWYRAPSRLNYGTTSLARDGTVWTTNFLGLLRPRQTYFNRKYMISDSLSGMESRAVLFNTETIEDVANIEELEVGEDITLYYDQNSFGATIGDGNEQCAGRQVACVGSSTPKIGFLPLFYISCGKSKSYLGSDAYHFRPDTGSMLKPYLCKDEDLSVRPFYKLLGFFEEGSCSEIENHTFVSEMCPLSTTVPGTSTSSNPSSAISNAPHVLSSSVPSNEYSLAPSEGRGMLPSASTANPATGAPSQFLKSTIPSTLPSLSLIPSAMPSASFTPSSLPSFFPTSLRGRDVPSISSVSEMPTESTMFKQIHSVEISMVLYGVSEEFDKNSNALFGYQNVTSNTIYNEAITSIDHPLVELEVTTTVEDQVVSKSSLTTRRRLLLKASIRNSQTNEKWQLTILSTCQISFKSTSRDHDMHSLVLGSFDTEEDQDAFIVALKKIGSSFSPVTSMDVQINESTDTLPSVEESNNVPYIVGAAIGGTAILFFIILLIFQYRKRSTASSGDGAIPAGSHEGNEGNYGTFSQDAAAGRLANSFRENSDVTAISLKEKGGTGLNEDVTR